MSGTIITPFFNRISISPTVASGTAWIDLTYPERVDREFRPGGDGERDSRGPSLSADVNFSGVLFVTGRFRAGTGGVYYGIVIAGEGVILDDSGPGTAHFFRDAALDGGWPPAEWDLPRVAVMRYLLGP